MTTLDELIDQCAGGTDTVEDAVRYVVFARPEFTLTAYSEWWLRNYVRQRLSRASQPRKGMR